MSKCEIKESIVVDRTIDQFNGPVLQDVEITGVLTGFEPVVLKNSFVCRTIKNKVIYQSLLEVYGNDGKRYEIMTIKLSKKIMDTIHSELAGKCVTVTGTLYYASDEDEPITKMYLLAYELEECNDESKKDTITFNARLREPVTICYNHLLEKTNAKMYLVEKGKYVYEDTKFIKCIVEKEKMQMVEQLALKTESLVKVTGYIQPSKFTYKLTHRTIESLTVAIIKVQKLMNTD